jgi:signal transduction histidine kinase
MMGFIHRTEIEGNPPPAGIAELVFYVFDDKFRLLYSFKSSGSDASDSDRFLLRINPNHASENPVLLESIKTHEPVSLVLSSGGGQRMFLHVLPYERKRGKWRYACVQVVTELPQSDSPDIAAQAFPEEFACLILVDGRNTIRSVSSREPVVLGFNSASLVGMSLMDHFSTAACEAILSAPANSGDLIHNCVFHCVDGSRCDTELMKLSAPDNYTLYGIYDVTPPEPNEEISEVVERERRRIGQDLHDSIGQLLTGISLLSRSLANRLGVRGNSDYRDAAQISELADDASNQIRQISRGLMPSEIVQHGLFVSLEELARITTDSCGIDCAARIDGDIEFSDGATESHLYRIAQEAVNNAVRHADAHCIEIIMSQENGIQQLVIRDDGTWKDPVESLAGIGLKTMEYRASVIGGKLEIDGCKAKGTQVICRVRIDDSLTVTA